MHTQSSRIRSRAALALAAGLAILAFSSVAGADPSSRVARLGYTAGAVSFSPAGENDWVQARVNRPMGTGDRLWVDSRARAEIQIGGAAVRIGADTGVSILNLDDRITQLQLSQGTLNVRVRRLDRGQIFEVDTPNLAFTLRQAGEYRIEVDADGNATEIYIRRGRGEVYGEGASYVIDSRQPYRFAGTGLREYEYIDMPRPDEFDRWSSDRDRRYDNSGSARYVSPDVVGYEDLDANGTWRSDAAYGHIWFPNRVAAGWAPYRDGHWAWIDPWGWTWVDDAPWGYAVSHYGRWTNQSGSWGWVPGPVRSRAYYAPALVAFVGGNNFQLTISSGNVGGIAWFPLAPREVYRPAYAVSRGYFENVNSSNTVINTTVINNYYNNSNVTNVVYANRQVAGAVVAMPAAAFVQSQPVAKASVRVSREMIASAPVAFIAPVAPTERSVRGAAAQGGKPPGRSFERPVVARTAPPPAHSGFAPQQQQLATKPGRPLDEAARRQLQPATATPVPVVRVVSPAQSAPPTALPPAVAPAPAGQRNGRGTREERGVPPSPAAPRGNGAKPQFAQPPAAVPVPAQANPQNPRGNREQRQPPAAIPPASAPAAANPPVFPPSAVQPADQRGQADPRGNRDTRPPVMTPVRPPAQAVPAQPTVAAPVAPPARQPEARGRSEPRGGDRDAPAPSQQVAPPAPVADAPSPRGRPDQRGNREQAGQRTMPAPTPAQPAQAIPAAPPAGVPAVGVPQGAIPQVAAPPVARGRPDGQPALNKAETRPAVNAPTAAPPQPRVAPAAEPRSQGAKPAEGKPRDKKKDAEEQKRDEERDNRKQKD